MLSNMFEDQLEELKSENNGNFYEMISGLGIFNLTSKSISCRILTVKVCFVIHVYHNFLVIVYWCQTGDRQPGYILRNIQSTTASIVAKSFGNPICCSDFRQSDLLLFVSEFLLAFVQLESSELNSPS